MCFDSWDLELCLEAEDGSHYKASFYCLKLDRECWHCLDFILVVHRLNDESDW